MQKSDSGKCENMLVSALMIINEHLNLVFGLDGVPGYASLPLMLSRTEITLKMRTKKKLNKFP